MVDFVNIIGNVGIVLAGTLLFPVLFALALFLLGFTTTGIVAGSVAAATMSCYGPIPAGSMFAMVQSVSAQGIVAIVFNIVMLPIELATGAVTMLCMWWFYAFDFHRFFSDLSSLMSGPLHYLSLAVNYSLSVVADMLLGSVAGIAVGLAVGTVVSCFTSQSERAPLLGSNTGSSDHGSASFGVCAMVFSVVGVIVGVVLGILYPYEIVSWS